jgi:molecular chaperone DnaK
MRVLGIDLGTTNTVAAIENVALPISSEDGRTTLPSVVSVVPNGTIQCGLPAKRRRSIDPRNTIFSSKRIIGRGWSEATTQEFLKRYPFDLVETEDQLVGFSTRAGIFTPVDIATIILTKTFELVKYHPSGFEKTLITVPASFNSQQRRETMAAGERAGLPGLALIEEPLAAAYAYGNVMNRVRRAGVYDLGGGTFDFSIVEWIDGTPRLIASESDLVVGGDDIDHLIAEWVADRVLESFHWDLRSYSEVYARLVAECERAKIRLSFFEETTLRLAEVDPTGPAGTEQLPVGREMLDPITQRLVQKTFVTCDSVLAGAGLRPADLDAIFLAGGSTHLAKVQEGVRSYFGKAGRFELDPTEVIALGASQHP